MLSSVLIKHQKKRDVIAVLSYFLYCNFLQQLPLAHGWCRRRQLKTVGHKRVVVSFLMALALLFLYFPYSIVAILGRVIISWMCVFFIRAAGFVLLWENFPRLVIFWTVSSPIRDDNARTRENLRLLLEKVVVLLPFNPVQKSAIKLQFCAWLKQLSN